MAERKSQGLWVEVPDGNANSKASVRDRAASHLRQLNVGVFVPALQNLRVVGEDGQEMSNLPIDSSTQFGVVLEAIGEHFGEVYRKLEIGQMALREHYGLKVSDAKVGYMPNFRVEFTTESSDHEVA